MVGGLTKSLPFEAFAPITRTCESYCTSIATRLSLGFFRVEVERYSISRLRKVRSVWDKAKSRSKVTSN
jgi:hypothetical protein